MKIEQFQSNRIITYILIGSAVLFTFTFIISYYPGQVLFPLLKALGLAFIIYIYGFFFMDRFKPGPGTPGLSATFAVGLVFTTFFFYLVSFLKILVPGVIIAFYVLPFLLVFLIRNPLPKIGKTLETFFNRSPLGYLPFLLPLIYAALPPSFYDTLVYHLGIPNFYLQQGGFVATPQFLFANTSIYYEISLIPAVFAGDMVPGFFHFLMGVIFLLAVTDFAVEMFDLKKPNVLLMLLLCMPMSVFLLSTVKNDLAGAFFIFLGIRFLLKNQYGFSALFWGFAIGIKYFNVLPLVLFLVIFLLRGILSPTGQDLFEKRSRHPQKLLIIKSFWKSRNLFSKRFLVAEGKRLLIFLLVVFVMVMPMLVKNYLLAGNPVFPFFSQHFKAEYWDASRYALMKRDVGQVVSTFRDAVKLPYTLSFRSLGFGGMVGAQFLIFLPFLLVTREAVKKKWLLFLFAFLTLFIGSYFTESMRFLYIVFLFFSVYLAVVYESVGQARRVVRYLFYIVIALNLVTALGAQEQMCRSFQLYSGMLNIEEYKASVFPTYPGIAYVNAKAEPGARVLLEGEARNYYLERPYLVASGLDYSILKKYLRPPGNVETFLAALKQDHIDYIIFNLGEFNRLQQSYRRLDEQELDNLLMYFRAMQSYLVFREKEVLVFKLASVSASPVPPADNRDKK